MTNNEIKHGGITGAQGIGSITGAQGIQGITGGITELIERLENYGYIIHAFSWGGNLCYDPKKSHHFRLAKSPKNDYPRDINYGEMLEILEAEEKIKLRSERIEYILSHGF
jgi:hypothetical protein